MPDALPRPADRPGTALFTSCDLDHCRSELNRFYYPVTMRADGVGTKFELAMKVIQLGPLTVGELSYGGPVTFTVAELDAYHVSMPINGRMVARHAGREVFADPALGAVFGPGSPVSTRHSANTAQLDVKMERAALEAELAGLLGRPIDGPIDLPPAIALTGGPAHSWSLLVRLLRDELVFEQSLVHQPLIAEQLRSSLLSGLLLSVPHRYHEELTTPATAGPPRAIRRVLETINEEPERAATVIDLARAAGMSVRSLQEGFRRHVGCTPMSYLQQVRLLRANAALREADPARVTVASVAHRWGFAHLGRFASAYRARFGESPSETLRKPS